MMSRQRWYHPLRRRTPPRGRQGPQLYRCSAVNAYDFSFQGGCVIGQDERVTSRIRSKRTFRPLGGAGVYGLSIPPINYDSNIPSPEMSFALNRDYSCRFAMRQCRRGWIQSAQPRGMKDNHQCSSVTWSPVFFELRLWCHSFFQLSIQLRCIGVASSESCNNPDNQQLFCH